MTGPGCKWADEMHHKTTRALYEYWNDVRKGGLAPRRFDIEPARIADVLPDTFMLERIARSLYRYRLSGTRIAEKFQAELRGMNFLDGWTPADAAVIERSMVTICEQGGVGLFALEARTVGGGTVPLEMLVLPLIHTEGAIDRLLGSIVALESPSWLGSERLAFKRLLRHEIIWPDGRPHVVIDRTHRQAPFLPHLRSARIVRMDRRQFRVYDGGLHKPHDGKL
jgi:hypothetical protein